MRFPDLPDWADALWTGIVLGVPLFGLLWLALPLARRNREWLLAATGALAVVAVAASLADLASVANIAKLGAATAAGFLFVSFFEHASWLVFVALAIPIADTVSVWRGPTRYIVTKQPSYFAADSVAFPPPGERVLMLRWRRLPADGKQRFTVTTWRVISDKRVHRRVSHTDGTTFDVLTDAHLRYEVELSGGAGKTALSLASLAEKTSAPTGAQRIVSARTRAAAERLGLTDVIFFAVFLAGALRFRLRPGWTWVGLVLGVMLSGVASLFDPFGIGGVPALPFISLGFLVPNADLLWRSVREPKSES
jgi:hypothetical protein